MPHTPVAEGTHLLSSILYTIKDRIAGDPMCDDVLWTDLTPQEISASLQAQGVCTGPRLVRRMLDTLGFAKWLYISYTRILQIQMLKPAAAKLLGWRRHEADLKRGMERRRSQGVPVALPVLWTALSVGGQAGAGLQHGKSLDVSREGMRLAVETSLSLFPWWLCRFSPGKGGSRFRRLGRAGGCESGLGNRSRRQV